MSLYHIVDYFCAQLGVYLRMNDAPVPATYGPSADELLFLRRLHIGMASREPFRFARPVADLKVGSYADVKNASGIS